MLFDQKKTLFGGKNAVLMVCLDLLVTYFIVNNIDIYQVKLFLTSDNYEYLIKYYYIRHDNFVSILCFS